MRTLRECLADYDTTLLRAIAERRGIELAAHQQPEMAEELATALCDLDSLSEALTWLTDGERRALETLMANEGRLSMHRFTQQFGEVRRFGPGSMAREAPWRAPISVAESLWYQGLIARGFAERSSLTERPPLTTRPSLDADWIAGVPPASILRSDAGVAAEFVFIPSDLVPLLPPPQIQGTPFEVPQVHAPYSVKAGTANLADDMCTLLSLIQNETIRVHKPSPQLRRSRLQRDATSYVGHAYTAQAVTLQAQLLDNDPDRLAFLFRLAQAAAFLRLEGRTLRLNREQVRGWLKQPRTDQLRFLQQAWRNNAGDNDLWHVPGIHCEDTGWHSDPLAARQAVIDMLRRCPVDTWLSIPGFIDTVHEQFPDFLRPDGDMKSWYIHDTRTGEYLMGAEHWEHIEGALLMYLFSGPLHWLGVLSLGYEEGEGKPSTVQICAWGTALLGLPQAADDRPGGPPHDDRPGGPHATRTGRRPPARITYQPQAGEGLVTISQTAPLFDRFQLARIAEWRASGTEYTYAVTPSALRRALGANIQIETVVKFLGRISQEDVPAALIAHIQSLASRYGHVRMRRAAILETRTLQVMSELRAHGRIRPYLRQALSPTLALVRQGDWDTLIAELEQAGYLPEIIF